MTSLTVNQFITDWFNRSRICSCDGHPGNWRCVCTSLTIYVINSADVKAGLHASYAPSSEAWTVFTSSQPILLKSHRRMIPMLNLRPWPRPTYVILSNFRTISDVSSTGVVRGHERHGKNTLGQSRELSGTACLPQRSDYPFPLVAIFWCCVHFSTSF
jgi:hypothetical protein